MREVDHLNFEQKISSAIDSLSADITRLDNQIDRIEETFICKLNEMDHIVHKILECLDSRYSK